MNKKSQIETVLRLKEKAENEISNRYAAVLKEIEYHQNYLSTIIQYKDQYESELEDTCRKGVSANKVRGYTQFLDKIKQGIIQENEKLKELRLISQSLEQEWLQAKKEKSVIEKLIEGIEKKVNKAALKREQTLSDERNITKSNRIRNC